MGIQLSARLHYGRLSSKIRILTFWKKHDQIYLPPTFDVDLNGAEGISKTT